MATGDDRDDTTTWRTLYEQARDALTRAGLARADGPGSTGSGPDREARWIVERAAGDALRIVADQAASARSHHHWRQMVDRRCAGEPLQYVLQRWPFRNLELYLDRRVLIPRPETEVVVDAVLDALDRVGGAVVDLGTGSGAIALSVVTERPGTEVWGVERSPAALDVARANCAGLGRVAATVRLVEGSWFAPLPPELAGRVGVVVSNPPYVADDEELPAVVADWEPVEALRSGADGLDDIATIVADAPLWLAPGGALVVEHGADQGDAVRALARDAGFSGVTTGQDLSGRDRFLVARP